MSEAETVTEWGVQWNNGYIQACVSEESARGRVQLYKDGVLINREVSRTEWRTVDSESSEDRRADASKPVVTCK